MLERLRKTLDTGWLCLKYGWRWLLTPPPPKLSNILLPTSKGYELHPWLPSDYWRYSVSADEYTVLLRERLRALTEAVSETRLTDAENVRDRLGWHAYLSIQGRDRDGSLMATITCIGPGQVKPYRRRIRLSAKQRLTLN